MKSEARIGRREITVLEQLLWIEHWYVGLIVFGEVHLTEVFLSS